MQTDPDSRKSFYAETHPDFAPSF
jgi:hypothetical protein